MKTLPLFRLLSGLTLAAILILASFGSVSAQDGYTIHMNRDFGFGNGSQIRGTFSISLIGAEENVSAVVFKIDDQDLAAVSQPPFKFQFNTSNYPSGTHNLSAVVTLKDGSTVTTPARTYQFATAEDEGAFMKEILFPLLGVLALIMVVGVGSQFLAARGKPAGGPEPGTQRNYGFTGGAICPKCNRPTPIHPLGMNLLVGKFSRCDNCGKWSILRRVPIDILRAAEIAEVKADQADTAGIEKTEEEKLRDLLDNSRYTKD